MLVSGVSRIFSPVTLTTNAIGARHRKSFVDDCQKNGERKRCGGAVAASLSLESPSFRRRTRCLGALTPAARVHIHEGHALREAREREARGEANEMSEATRKFRN